MHRKSSLCSFCAVLPFSVAPTPRTSSALSAQKMWRSGSPPHLEVAPLARLSYSPLSIGLPLFPADDRHIRAEDTFRPGRSVAIKVMKLGCGAIGIREVRYMRFLGSLPKSDSSPGGARCVKWGVQGNRGPLVWIVVLKQLATSSAPEII